MGKCSLGIPSLNKDFIIIIIIIIIIIFFIMIMIIIIILVCIQYYSTILQKPRARAPVPRRLVLGV